MQIPEPVKWVMNQIEMQQEEVFLVGGCVRDLLLHRPIHDFDMTTSMPACEMIKLFETLDCKVLPTGLKHGTVTIIRKHQMVEVTTYRIESTYENHRFPTAIAFTNNLHEDLKRRDFTINAMAYHPEIGLIDLFGGQIDCQNKIIRCVGVSKNRFQEDALRILRAIRFRCQLQFEIEEDTLSAIKQCAPDLQYISKERIRDEFTKMVMSNQPNLLQYLKDVQVLSYILPEIVCIYDFEQYSPWHCYDVLTHSDIALNHSINASLRVKLAHILHDIGKPKAQFFKGEVAHYYGHAAYSAALAKAMLLELRYSKQLVHEVCLLIQYHDTRIHNRYHMRKLLYLMHNDFTLVHDLLFIQTCDDRAKVREKVKERETQSQMNENLLAIMEREHDIFDRRDLQVNGSDMIKLGFEKAQIQQVLDYLIKLVLKTPSSNTKEKLMDFAINYKLRQNND